MEEHNVISFEIQSDTNLRVAERNKIDDDEIAIEQGNNELQHMRIGM